MFKNKFGKVIYVGKAKNIKKRVKSYFQKTHESSPKTKYLLQNIYNLDYTISDSEIEALVLESNLIKEYRPKFNVTLKDDKSYPFVKITTSEKFPRVYFTRRTGKNTGKKQDKYFGPFTSAENLRNTLKTLHKIFPFRTCGKLPKRECLFYHIKLCPAPCTAKISEQDYQKVVKNIISFLEGKTESLVKNLTEQMKKEAKFHNFEKAATLRDQIEKIKFSSEKQKVISAENVNQDILAVCKKRYLAVITFFSIREGKLIKKDNFELGHIQRVNTKELLTSFAKQYYQKPQILVPKEIILSEEIDDQKLIEKLLSEKLKEPGSRFKKVKIIIPKRGRKRKLIKLALKNAEQYLEAKFKEKEESIKTLIKLKKALYLAKIPRRIECYDVSNISGKAATGSMIVFSNGKTNKSEYRRFKIKTIKLPNDYAMIKEIFTRRFARLKANRKDSWPTPDLIIVDGGKGQLNTALSVLKEIKDSQKIDINIPIISLAKKKEEVFVPKKSKPILLPKNSQSLFLVQRIRDEAHRFAIAYHKKLREKEIRS